MHCGDVIGAENLLRRIAFRQHVYDGSVHRVMRAKVGFVEGDGHVDAPVGNAVVVAACGGQPVQPLLFRSGRAHAVHRYGSGIVDPYDIFAQRVATALRKETPGWRGALVGSYLFHRPAAYPRHRVIAVGGTQQHWRRREEAGIGGEGVQPRSLLVDDEEGGARVVVRVGHPVRDMANIVRRGARVDIGESRARFDQPGVRRVCRLPAGRDRKKKRQRGKADDDATPNRVRGIHVCMRTCHCAGRFHGTSINDTVRPVVSLAPSVAISAGDELAGAALAGAGGLLVRHVAQGPGAFALNIRFAGSAG